MSIQNTRLAVSALGNKIVLARFGKDKSLALESRDAANEFWQTLVSYAFDGVMPEHGQGSEVKFGGGDEWFTVTVRRDPKPEAAA